MVLAKDRPTSIGVSASTTSDVYTESGIGALLTWADALWFTTYPNISGTTINKGMGLWRMGKDRRPVLVAETNGTHAGRHIHRPTMKALIGEHVIDKDGTVHHITGTILSQRITGYCTDPLNANTHVFAMTMGGSLYRVDLSTYAAVFVSDAKAALGIAGEAHFKAIWRGNTRIVVAANNLPPDGRLAAYDWTAGTWTTLDAGNNSWIEAAGSYWTVGSNFGNNFAFGHNGEAALMWLLSVGAGSVQKKFRLPLAHEQQIHGWQQEWMRLRPTMTERYLLNLHGTMFMISPFLTGSNDPTVADSFPRVEPISRYARTITDHTVFDGQLVLSHNDLTMIDGNFLNAGQSSSGLTFLHHEEMWAWGKPTGTGYLIKNGSLGAGAASDLMLMRGYDRKDLHVSNGSASSQSIDVVIYRNELGFTYKTLTVAAGAYVVERDLPGGDWIAVKPQAAATALSAWVVYS